jgi:hypothetical protein
MSHRWQLLTENEYSLEASNSSKKSLYFKRRVTIVNVHSFNRKDNYNIPINDGENFIFLLPEVSVLFLLFKFRDFMQYT